MNYYDLNIGDFSSATQGLDLVDVGIFIRLQNRFMLTEKPIKTQWVSLAFPKEVQERVHLILEGLFEETEDGWVYGPYVDVLARYSANRLKNQENGKKGGRPRKTQENPMGSSGFCSETQAEPNEKATNNQEPITNSNEELPKGSSRGNSHADADELPHEDELQLEGIEKPLRQQNCPTKEIVGLYNQILGPQLGNVLRMTDARGKLVRARWLDMIEILETNERAETLEGFKEYFAKVGRSDFLMGRSTDFRAGFDWIMNAGNFTKVYEGKYVNRR